MNDTEILPGGDLHMARLTPEYALWHAVLANPTPVRRTEDWAVWSLIKDEFGWEVLTAATRRCEPNEKGYKNANLVRKICVEMKRQKDLSDRQAAQDAANAALKEKAQSKARLVKVGDKWVVQQ